MHGYLHYVLSVIAIFAATGLLLWNARMTFKSGQERNVRAIASIGMLLSLFAIAMGVRGCLQ